MARMILVGHFDSPFVRRVAISLQALGFIYERDTRSVFSDFEEMRTVNPLARIPSLKLDSGETLIDSFAILDWLDREVGAERALMPKSGAARTHAMQIVALATGAIDKFGAINYEQIIRPPALRWPDWIKRCHAQGTGALAALEHKDWAMSATLDQLQVTTGCLLGYLALSMPNMVTSKTYPKLHAFWMRCAAMPEFVSTSVSHYSLPQG